MSRLTDQDNDEIADLERMNRRSPSGDGGGDLNGPLYVDGSEGAPIGARFPVGEDGKARYAFIVSNLELKQSKGGFDEKTQRTKESIPYLELTLTCIGGEYPEMAGEIIQDRLMAKGKGVTRFKIFAKAVGMWDDDNDRFSGRPIDFMDAQVWGTVKIEKSTYQGQERERSIIDFAGYEPIDKYPLPDDGYFDPPTPEPAPAVKPAVKPAAAVVAPPAAPVAEAVEDETLEAEEDDEGLEPLEEAEAAPEPARPAVRPRARAAGQPGAQPPWAE
jgi:hypothetical protein